MKEKNNKPPLKKKRKKKKRRQKMMHDLKKKRNIQKSKSASPMWTKKRVCLKSGKTSKKNTMLFVLTSEMKERAKSFFARTIEKSSGETFKRYVY